MCMGDFYVVKLYDIDADKYRRVFVSIFISTTKGNSLFMEKDVERNTKSERGRQGELGREHIQSRFAIL